MTRPTRWLDAKGVAEFLSLAPRVVRERVALMPGFPAPMRIGGVGHPRWREDEVAEWAERQRQMTAGRERAA